MFADAVERVRSFTLPVVVSRRLNDGACDSSVATCVIVNDEGWFLTAAHVLQGVSELAKAKDAWTTRQAQLAESETLPPKERQRARRELGPLPTPHVTDFSVWWGFDGVVATDATIDASADLALARLEPFKPEWVKDYPVFLEPGATLRQGTSLCRIGFPFCKVDVKFTDGRGFEFDPNGNLALFPIEGIFTRELVRVAGPGVPAVPTYIETSSPGLRGQSGGPIFDAQGRVVGIQSSTAHYSLGFDPPGPNKTTEHQFLNAGRGVHPARIAELLASRKIKYAR